MANLSRPGRLSGRTALVTGASRGIGRAIALRYAQEGADLLLTATNRAKLEETCALAQAHGGSVGLYLADVSDRAAVLALVDAAVGKLGHVDVLVNNAGVYKAARLVDYAPEDFDRVMQVNLYGAFHVMQLVLRHMQARGRGKVINIASTAGKWGSINQSAYNASKHALIGLTRCAGLEMGPHGINVNAICPGFVETDMLEEFRAHGEILGVPFDKVKDAALARVPLRRFLKPAEIADLAVYLGASESDGMTGQSLLLDGGMLLV
ncbi:MAG: SDR family oxidoreductase [Betaproteobacteria bacterium]|nr:MAG: SDR family oxidoreductase [Betaproteobacteria bacterium]